MSDDIDPISEKNTISIRQAFPTINTLHIAKLDERPFKFNYTGYELVAILKLDMHTLTNISDLDGDNVKVYRNGNTYLFHRDKAIRVYASNCPHIDKLPYHVKDPVYDIKSYNGYNLFKSHVKDCYFIVDASKVNPVRTALDGIDSAIVMDIYKGTVVIVNNTSPQDNICSDISYIIRKSNPLDIYPLFESKEDLINALRETEKVYNCWASSKLFKSTEVPLSNVSEPDKAQKAVRYEWIKGMYDHSRDKCIKSMGLIAYVPDELI